MPGLVITVILVLLTSSCTSSTAVLGSPADEVVISGDEADDLVDGVDPNWAEPARPISEEEPELAATAEPEPARPSSEEEPEPAATVKPEQADEPESATSESSIVGGTDTDGEIPAEVLFANARDALDSSPVVQIVVDRRVGPGEANDFSSQAGVIIDRAAGLRRATLTLTGKAWDSPANRNALGRLQTNDTYQALMDQDLFYLRAEPALDGLPDGVRWTNGLLGDFESLQQSAIGPVIMGDPASVQADVRALLTTEYQPERVSKSTFKIDLPHAELLRLDSGSSVLSQVALDQISGVTSDFEAFTATSPIRFEFDDTGLRKITLDLTPLFNEAADVTGTRDLRGVQITETYVVSFGSVAVLSLPDADEVLSPTESYPDAHQVGDCLGRDEGDLYLIVECTQPHEWEVIETGRFDDAFGSPYVGRDAMFDRIQEPCRVIGDQRFGIEIEKTSLNVDMRVPDEAAWDAGDRSYACVLRFDQPVSVPAAEVDLTQFQSRLSRFDLREGHCVRDEEFGFYIEVVDCEEPHFYEAFKRFEVDSPGGGYPGRAVVQEQAGLICVGSFDAVVERSEEIAFADVVDYEIFSLLPGNTETWDTYNDRFVLCMAHTDQQEAGRKFTTGPPAESGAAAD